MADKAGLFKMKTLSARLFYQVSLLSKKQLEKIEVGLDYVILDSSD